MATAGANADWRPLGWGDGVGGMLHKGLIPWFGVHCKDRGSQNSRILIRLASIPEYSLAFFSLFGCVSGLLEVPPVEGRLRAALCDLHKSLFSHRL